MRALLRGALAVTLLAAASRAAEMRASAPPALRFGRAQGLPGSAARATGESALCPAGTLPDAGVCVPVPLDAQGGGALGEQRNVHRDKKGRVQSYDHIPRRPERPADYRRYQLPVPPLPGQSFVTSGYDLDLPDAEQRRGPHLGAVGHGGIDIAQKRGTEALLVALENQVGEARVLYVGPLFGNSVVTHHSLREAGELRDYLAIYGHLQRAAPGLARGQSLREGALLGYVGDSGSPGDVHLHYEVRRAREGVGPEALGPGELTNNAKTVACDPRNVLPLLP
jgi:murein DD-endopeptidase MepM/ murein hydrolase activator NlpD